MKNLVALQSKNFSTRFSNLVYQPASLASNELFSSQLKKTARKGLSSFEPRFAKKAKLDDDDGGDGDQAAAVAGPGPGPGSCPVKKPGPETNGGTGNGGELFSSTTASLGRLFEGEHFVGLRLLSLRLRLRKI